MIGLQGFPVYVRHDEKTVDIMLRNANKKSLAVLCGRLGWTKLGIFTAPVFIWTAVRRFILKEKAAYTV
jgi:hypothetical protein